MAEIPADVQNEWGPLATMLRLNAKPVAEIGIAEPETAKPAPPLVSLVGKVARLGNQLVSDHRAAAVLVGGSVLTVVFGGSGVALAHHRHQP